MKILIVEDSAVAMNEIKNELEGHELTCVSSIRDFFCEARNSIRPPYPECSYRNGEMLLQFDCVITDINMPAPTDRGGDSKGDMEGPIGLMIALRAIQLGVKRVMIISDTNHHENNPISKGMDLFDNNEGKGSIIGETKISVWNAHKKNGFLKNTFDWLLSDKLIPYSEWKAQGLPVNPYY